MSHEHYDAARTFHVSSAQVGANTNYLMRGNMPLKKDGQTFAYDEMNAAFQALLGSTFDLQNFNLINISLITNYPTTQAPDEGYYLMAEFNAFGISNKEYATWFPQSAWPPYMNKCAHFAVQEGTGIAGNSGSIIWYPIQGCGSGDGPSSCSVIDPAQYDINGLVEMLNTLLNTANPNGKPTLIYYHCINGHDRTSSLTACYMMKYMGPVYTFSYVTTKPAPQGAMLQNNHGVQWNPPYYNLVQYYYDTYIPKPM